MFYGKKLLNHEFILINHKNNNNQTALDIIKVRLIELEDNDNSSKSLKFFCRKIIHFLEHFQMKQRWNALCYNRIHLRDL